jgi:acetate kinase
LRGIEAVSARYPDLPQVACFDTAFHHGLPEVARRFALPSALYDQGVLRYGFHGLSYEFVVETLGAALSGRSIVAHLGSGASMVALRDAKPIDTTMGFTPAGGFMMGTRPGDLDPGIVLYLLKAGYSARDLERVLDHESGLLGVSGSTSDMRVLLEHRADDPSAAMAVEMFCYQARKTIGSYVAALGGVDTLVFTGGIGERAGPIRDRICSGLECFGIELDRDSNQAGKDVISQPGSACTVRVVATNEELMIARHTRRIVFPEG